MRGSAANSAGGDGASCTQAAKHLNSNKILKTDRAARAVSETISLSSSSRRPGESGAHDPSDQAADEWVPAFAGTTDWGDFVALFSGHIYRGPDIGSARGQVEKGGGQRIEIGQDLGG